MQDEGRRQRPAVDPRIAEILPGLPRVGALDALLRDVDALRLGLETDLTLAAGAVEAGAPEVAVDVVTEDLASLRAFEARALAHLARLDEADRAAAEPAAPVVPVVPLAPRRARRARRLLPAAPFAAAAALVGLLGFAPQTGPAQPDVQPVPAAMASWAELERLSAAGAPPQELQEAAEDFHADIASLLAEAERDPAAARQALELLRRGQVALESVQDPTALAAVLAQSRLLTARLLATLPPVAPTLPVVDLPVPLPSSPPRDPSTPPAPAPLPTVVPQASPPARSAAPAQPRPTPEAPAPATSAPAPSATPRPTPGLLPPASPPPSLGTGAHGGLPLPRPGS